MKMFVDTHFCLNCVLYQFWKTLMPRAVFRDVCNREEGKE